MKKEETTKTTRLDKCELWPDTLPASFLRRADETINFISSKDVINSADCGEDNPLKQLIENYFCVKICSLDWDFNRQAPKSIKGKFDTIFCFEVLEHVMNPLLFLGELKKLLNFGGVIYLSTPRQWPQIIKSVHHYHEIPTDRLMWLFNEAGLEVVKEGRATIAGRLTEHIHGIRPLLRYFQKTRLYKLKVANK